MEKIIAGLVQMDSGPDMNENMRMAEQPKNFPGGIFEKLGFIF